MNVVQTIPKQILLRLKEVKEYLSFYPGVLLAASKQQIQTIKVALVGLSNHRSLGNSSSTMLEYSKSVVDLYTGVTGYLIESQQFLQLLSSIKDISDRRIAHLPS